MKPTELRIGNFILYGETNVIFEVGSIGPQWYYVKNKELEVWVQQFEFHPIPLTEEWLFKFGFRCFPDHFKKKSRKRQSFSISWCGNAWILIDTDITTFIKYVHHLQNLYFALTGEELTIKPKK